MNRNLCLDIGDVLCRINFDEFVYYLINKTGLSALEIKKKLNYIHGMHDIGLITMEQFLEMELDIKPCCMQEALSKWNSVVEFDYDIMDKIYDIAKDHNLKIALLSNVGKEHSEMVCEKMNNHKLTDLIYVNYFSCYVGSRKPNVLFYQSFLSLFPGCEKCVYLDDNEDNLDMAQSFEFDCMEFSLSKMTEEEINNKLIELRKKYE